MLGNGDCVIDIPRGEQRLRMKFGQSRALKGTLGRFCDHHIACPSLRSGLHRLSQIAEREGLGTKAQNPAEVIQLIVVDRDHGLEGVTRPGRQDQLDTTESPKVVGGCAITPVERAFENVPGCFGIPQHPQLVGRPEYLGVDEARRRQRVEPRWYPAVLLRRFPSPA